MVLLAAIVVMTDERFITGMSTLMKSEITLRSESTIAARIIARVFPIVHDPSDMVRGTYQMNGRGECYSLQLRMHELVVT